MPWDVIEKRNYRNLVGISIKTQEIARLSTKENKMTKITEFFKVCLIDKKEPKKVVWDVPNFRKDF